MCAIEKFCFPHVEIYSLLYLFVFVQLLFRSLSLTVLLFAKLSFSILIVLVHYCHFIDCFFSLSFSILDHVVAVALICHRELTNIYCLNCNHFFFVAVAAVPIVEHARKIEKKRAERILMIWFRNNFSYSTWKTNNYIDVGKLYSVFSFSISLFYCVNSSSKSLSHHYIYMYIIYACALVQ